MSGHICSHCQGSGHKLQIFIASSDVSYKFVDLRSGSKPNPPDSTLATDPDSTLDLTQNFFEESDGNVPAGRSLVTTANTNATNPSSQTVVPGLKRKAAEVLGLEFLSHWRGK